jgi:hypothetical protein
MEHFHRQLLSFEWNKDLNIEDCPVLTVAHATSLEKANKIIVSGFASLSTIDSGFYGKGMYFSSSAIYTLPYCFSYRDPCIMLCFVLPGNPFPVIESPTTPQNLVGKPILSGYQSHYVVTKINGLPVEENYFGRKFNEIVIDQESQVVPIFLIELDNSNFDILEKHIQREKLIINTNNNSLSNDDIDINGLIQIDDLPNDDRQQSLTDDDRSDKVHLYQINPQTPDPFRFQ